MRLALGAAGFDMTQIEVVLMNAEVALMLKNYRDEMQARGLRMSE
jgi:hypothetical protein